ncbi:hypothetical protein N8I77_003145 [Diaporthe amygdali]|uniref:Uncharacterized protein n=1 Tax=Phomopsis amygdali TaxID=1214568 RepID=A0AAD9W4Q0_PHOAM|nr:hypothetical protein N8I77_003145 [Diaporthe amygdali]
MLISSYITVKVAYSLSQGASFEDPGSKVDHLHLGNNAIEALDKCQMGRVFIQPSKPYLIDPIKAPGGERLTWCPSGLLSFPPFPVFTYGCLDSGCTHLSLRANIPSQTYHPGSAGVGVASERDATLDVTYTLDVLWRSQWLEGEHYNVDDSHSAGLW